MDKVDLPKDLNGFPIYPGDLMLSSFGRTKQVQSLKWFGDDSWQISFSDGTVASSELCKSSYKIVPPFHVEKYL